MKKFTIALAIAILAGTVPSAFAQTPASISELQNKIQALMTQLRTLQQQQTQLQEQRQAAVSELVSTLRQGMQGNQVSTLQALLAAEDVYPEAKITGYYGQLTAQAVKRLQKKYGLGQNGSVDSKTLEKIKELMEDHPVAIVSNSSTSAQLCAIVPPGHLIARGWLKKNKAPVIPTCQNLPIGILQKLGLASTSIPTSTDSNAPVISGIAVNAGPNSATVNWNTNELSSSQIVFGTSSSALASSTAMNSGLAYWHSQQITGLQASTTYYFSVQSKDAAGNLASSSVQSFTTSIAPDQTAPAISNVSATSTANSITVSWTTDEPASSQILYGASTTLGSVTALDNALVTSHSQMFSGLQASTTYYFSVQSRDAAGNATTSAQYSVSTQ